MTQMTHFPGDDCEPPHPEPGEAAKELDTAAQIARGLILQYLPHTYSTLNAFMGVQFEGDLAKAIREAEARGAALAHRNAAKRIKADANRISKWAYDARQSEGLNAVSMSEEADRLFSLADAIERMADQQASGGGE